MAGRKQKEDKSFLSQILSSVCDRIYSEGRVISKKSIVWSEICTEHNLSIHPKTLYNFAIMLNNKKNVNVLEQNVLLSDDNSISNTSCDEESSNEENVINNLNVRFFKVFITSENWLEMEPSIIYYDRKEALRKDKKMYLKLKTGIWTRILSNILWKDTKIPCAWTFKYNFIALTDQSKYFFKSKAVCGECNSVVDLLVLNNVNINTLDGLSVECKLTGQPENIKHKKKRRLFGTKRNEIAQEMLDCNKKASLLRKEQAKLHRDLFDKECPLEQSLEVLRKAKSELKNKDRVHKNPIEALVNIAQKNPFSNIIHEVGNLKFFIHYWSPDQTRVYNEYCKIEKFPSIMIDATGQVVRKLQRVDGLSGHLFLYCVVIKIPNEHEGQVPVCQMISERHNTNAIHYWLGEWQRLGAIQPKLVTCDFSVALLSASCRAFTGLWDMHSYIEACYNILTKKLNARLPSCFIRVDVAHLIKSVCNWKEIHPSSTKKRVREFYIRGVGQLILSSHLDEAKIILSQLFTVALSEYEGQYLNNDTDTHCEKAKKSLINKYAFGIEQSAVRNLLDLEIDNNLDNTEEDVNNETCNNCMKSWVDNILNECRSMVEMEDTGNRDNIMHMPKIVNRLKILCYRLPLWTGIMVPYFGYGNLTSSSAGVESYYNDLKTRLMPSCPIRVDEFVTKHSAILEGTMKLASGLKYFVYSENKTEFLNQPQAESSGSKKEIKEIEHVETWSKKSINNQSEKIKLLSNAKRSIYLNPCSEWATMDLDDNLAKPIPIGILKNGGNISTPKTRKTKGKFISLSNTCAFDSFIQILACAICDSKNLHDAEIVTNSLPIYTLANLLSEKNISNQLYQMRAEILFNIFSSQISGNIVNRVDCETHMTYMIKKLSFISYKQTNICHTCKTNKQTTYPYISTQASMIKQGIENLQKSLYILENIPCSSCNNVCESVNNFSNIIAVDLFTNETNADGYEITPTIILNSIPKKIVLNNTTLFLRGGIEFQPPFAGTGIGHYTAVCRRSDWSWEQYNDQKDKALKCSNQSSLQIPILIYSV